MKDTNGNDATVEETLVLTFFDIANLLSKLGEEVAGSAGLTTQQWLVLLQIAGDPNFPIPAHAPMRRSGVGVMASEIALERGVSRASVSVLISQLLKRGLIRQEEEAGDRRRKRLFLTNAGQETVESLDAARRLSNRELFADLGPEELEVLLDSLRKCLGRLWLAGNHGARSAGSAS